MSGGTAATATVAGGSAAAAAAAAASAAAAGTVIGAGAATGLGIAGAATAGTIGAATTTAAVAGTSLASLATYASLASSVIGGIGAIGKGMAGSQSAKYNAAIAGQNATIAAENAHRASMAGEATAAMKERETRAEVGQIQANQAAKGINVNTGSAVDVRSSAAENGELDAITIRANAARDAYGYQTQGASYTGQAKLNKAEAGYSSAAGYLDGGTTLLGGVGNAGLKYQAYQNAGGL